METKIQKQKVKLQRLRDITLYHFKRHEGIEVGKTTLGQMNEFEEDIRVWVKNFLLTCRELHVRPDVTWIGEEKEFD